MSERLKAVIDLGSNSVRLVIYQEGHHGTQRELDNLKQAVRLSAHVDDEGRITEDGIRMTIRVIAEFAQLCRLRGASEIIAVATQAIRAAANRDEILERIVAETKVPVRVITGQEEAYYGYLAVANSLPIEDGLTIDVGGGSTELTYFRGREPLHSVSIPYGAVSLTREFVRSDPISGKDIKAMVQAVRNELDECTWLNALHCPAVGMGGTARALARIEQRKINYPLDSLHGFAMNPAAVSEILNVTKSMPLEKRTDVSGLSSDRADIIVAGALIIDEILKRSSATSFITSSKGLRDGILVEQVLRARRLRVLPDIVEYSLENIFDQFHLNRSHATRVWKLSAALWSHLAALGMVQDGKDVRQLLMVSALLHDIGRSISIYNTRDHNFYMLLHIPIVGLSHRERILVAAITAFKSMKQTDALLAPYATLLQPADTALVSQVGTVVRLMHTLDRAESGAVTGVEAKNSDGTVVIFHSTEPLVLQLDVAKEWMKTCRKVFRSDIRLEVRVVEESTDV